MFALRSLHIFDGPKPFILFSICPRGLPEAMVALTPSPVTKVVCRDQPLLPDPMFFYWMYVGIIYVYCSIIKSLVSLKVIPCNQIFQYI